MTAAPVLQPFGRASSTAQYLGYFASGDRPAGREAGVYRVSEAGWYARAYGELFGPFPGSADALECLAWLEERGPQGKARLMKLASGALWLLAKILSALFCVAVLIMLLAAF